MTLNELAAATAGMGDHWGDVPSLAGDPEHTACESCDWHPLTAEMAAVANRLFAEVRARGGGAPAYVYVHCASDLFLEWGDPSGRRVSVNFWPRGVAPQVMLAGPDRPTAFFDLEGFDPCPSTE